MRTIWFAAGTAVGVYATSKVRRAAEAVTVDGIHDRLTGWFAGARVVRDEVRLAALEKETQLRARLAEAPDGADEAAPGALPAPPDNVRQLNSRHDHRGKGDH